METTNGITKEVKRTKVTVTSVKKGQFQTDNEATAELRQKVRTITTYPGKQSENDMQQNVFNNDEFNAESKEYTNDEIRVAWIDVPAGTSVDDVAARLTNNSTLYRVLSNAPILTSGHKNAIARGIVSLDKIADSQILRYPEGNPKAGQIILDPQDKVQYRKIFFWKTHKDDIDLRGNPDYPEYRSEAIKAELGNTTVAKATPVINLQTDEEWN